MYLDSCNNLCIARAIYALERAEYRLKHDDAEHHETGGEG